MQVESEQLCSLCRKWTEASNEIRYYLLPTKLVRAKHRRLERAAFYCSDCFDAMERVPYFVNGQSCSLPKFDGQPGVSKGQQYNHFACPICLTPLVDRSGGLYGIIAYTYMVGGNVNESWPLATICGECAESHGIELVRPTPQAIE